MPHDTGFVDQNSRLNKIARTGLSISYDDHARRQMISRNILRQDVRCALTNGNVIGVEIIHDDEERWRIEGNDIDDNALIIIILAIQEGDFSAYVITAFEPN
ncbi:MAG: DUF4258 domain-containing protein [Alphaproteobacteria bacterium]|nr:DUF4258 domain-containing protein [Alphaproteobacteria bacterium]